MLKADIGDFLYILIAIVLMVAGGLEKYVKAKKQQQNQNIPPQPSHDYDEYEEGESAEREPTRPQSLEDMVRRMLQTTEDQDEITETTVYDEAQSLETIPVEPVRRSYQPITDNFSKEEEIIYSINTTKEDIKSILSEERYDFDLRKAVIASEILQRKYQ